MWRRRSEPNAPLPVGQTANLRTPVRHADHATRLGGIYHILEALRDRFRATLSRHDVISVCCYHHLMAVTAPTPRADEISVAAQLFHGLSDPTRLSILLALLDGERRVSDLVGIVGTSQSNVSNHLACLKDCGLVVDRPAERRQVFYSISHPELGDLLVSAERLLARSGHEVRLCDNPLMGAGAKDDG